MTVGELSSGDPRHFTIVDNRLVLLYSEEGHRMFMADATRNFERAYKYWWVILSQRGTPFQ